MCDVVFWYVLVGVFFFVFIFGYEAIALRVGGFGYALDEAIAVGGYDGVYFAEWEPVYIYLLDGYDVAVIDDGLHRVSCGIDPKVAIVGWWVVYKIVGFDVLNFNDAEKSVGKIYVVIGYSLLVVIDCFISEYWFCGCYFFFGCFFAFYHCFVPCE